MRLRKQSPDVVVHIAGEVIARGRRIEHLRGGFAIAPRFSVVSARQVIVTGIEPLCRPVVETVPVEAANAGDDAIDLRQIEPERQCTAVRQVMAIFQRRDGPCVFQIALTKA